NKYISSVAVDLLTKHFYNKNERLIKEKEIENYLKDLHQIKMINYNVR
ncbi:head morphogenesis protein, partial [Staphylococcus warneri]